MQLHAPPVLWRQWLMGGQRSLPNPFRAVKKSVSNRRRVHEGIFGTSGFGSAGGCGASGSNRSIIDCGAAPEPSAPSWGVRGRAKPLVLSPPDSRVCCGDPDTSESRGVESFLNGETGRADDALGTSLSFDLCLPNAPNAEPKLVDDLRSGEVARP